MVKQMTDKEFTPNELVNKILSFVSEDNAIGKTPNGSVIFQKDDNDTIHVYFTLDNNLGKVETQHTFGIQLSIVDLNDNTIYGFTNKEVLYMFPKNDIQRIRKTIQNVVDVWQHEEIGKQISERIEKISKLF